MSYLCTNCNYDCPGTPCTSFTAEQGPGADEDRCRGCKHGSACHPASTGDAHGARSAAQSRDRLHHGTEPVPDEQGRCTLLNDVLRDLPLGSAGCLHHGEDGTPTIQHCAVCLQGEAGVDCDHLDGHTACAYCYTVVQEPTPALEYWYQGGGVDHQQLVGVMDLDAALSEALGEGLGVVLLPDGSAWRLDREYSWSAVRVRGAGEILTSAPGSHPLHHVWYSVLHLLPSRARRLCALRAAPRALRHVSSIEWPALREDWSARVRFVAPKQKMPRHPFPLGTRIRTSSGEEDGNGSCPAGTWGVVVAPCDDRDGHAYHVQFPLEVLAEAPDDPEAIVVQVVIGQGDGLDDADQYEVAPAATTGVLLEPADRVEVMLAVADRAYRRHIDQGLPDPETARQHTFGDGLAEFLVTEISEVAEGSEEPLHEAINALRRILREVEDVYLALAQLAESHEHRGG